MAMDVKINGTLIKTPNDCAVQKFRITKASRSASGLMKMDIIAKKCKLGLSYNVIAGTDLKQIQDIIYGDALFFTVEFYDDSGTLQSKTMYCGDISYDRFRTGGLGGWYWKNFKVELIEQ